MTLVLRQVSNGLILCTTKIEEIDNSHLDGITYERHSIETHFEKIGEFDPLTRRPCTKKDLIPNLSLREAIEDFLTENGWAAGN